jgi:hypothetical protein
MFLPVLDREDENPVATAAVEHCSRIFIFLLHHRSGRSWRAPSCVARQWESASERQWQPRNVKNVTQDIALYMVEQRDGG